jgi:hypothetical protein
VHSGRRRKGSFLRGPSNLLAGGKTVRCVRKAVPGARVQCCTSEVVARGGTAESNDEVLSETDVAFDKIKRVCSIRLYPSYSRPRWGVFKDIEKI